MVVPFASLVAASVASLALAAASDPTGAPIPSVDRARSVQAFCEGSQFGAAVRRKAVEQGRHDRASVFCACYGREIASNLDERAFAEMVEGRTMPSQADLDEAYRDRVRLEAENRITPAVIALACLSDALN